jgi:hypothetical protein
MSVPFVDDSYEGVDPSKEIFIKSFTDNNETIYIQSSVVWRPDRVVRRCSPDNHCQKHHPDDTFPTSETFIEGVTDKSTIFKELVWFAYKVCGVMCSASVRENSWSIEGWIHSKRRNRLSQELVERLLRAHTNLRESLDVFLYHL